MEVNERPRPRRLVLWGVLIGFLALGYLSAWTSRHQCQVSTARTLMQAMPRGSRFTIPQENARPGWLVVWGSLGAHYRVLNPAMEGWSPTIPWCAFGEARSRYPFVTAVDYGWVAAPQVGDGGRLWYFCLFGMTFELGRTYDWVT